MADRQVNEAEAIYLDVWLKENFEIAADWPGNVLADQLRAVLADAVLTPEDLNALRDTIDAIIGHADGATGGVAMTLCDALPASKIRFAGSSFIFTGTVIGASRKTLKALVQQLGGTAAPDSALFFADARGALPKLDYLVVGGVAARDWAHESFGTKIQCAMRAREYGSPLKIINDETFWLAVKRARGPDLAA